MEKVLLFAIGRLIGFFGDVEAEKELRRIICDDGGVMTVAPKYRVEKIVEEIEESIKMYTIE